MQDKGVKFRDSLNRSPEIPREAVEGGIFERFSGYFRPKVVSEVMSGVDVL